MLQVCIVSSAAEASAAAPPGGSVSVVVSEGLQLLLPLAGLFDVEKELKRLDKQKQKVCASVCALVCACVFLGVWCNGLTLQLRWEAVIQSWGTNSVCMRPQEVSACLASL